MKKLFDYANEYVQQSDWKDMALLKFCLASMGLLIGVSLSQRMKKWAAFGAAAVFIVTYLPLITKFLGIVTGGGAEGKETVRLRAGKEKS